MKGSVSVLFVVFLVVLSGCESAGAGNDSSQKMETDTVTVKYVVSGSIPGRLGVDYDDAGGNTVSDTAESDWEKIVEKFPERGLAYLEVFSGDAGTDVTLQIFVDGMEVASGTLSGIDNANIAADLPVNP